VYPIGYFTAHIEEGFLQAERGELIDADQARREIQGAAPPASVVFDGRGNLYGTTLVSGFYGRGKVFELVP
jgi:hypothetical protein